jgi:hypothetical protein
MLSGRPSPPMELDFFSLAPEQFLAHAADTPERRLMVAVFERALDDLRPQYRGTPTERRRIRREAEAWFASEAEAWPFSFANICQALGLDPAWIRQAIERHIAEREAA